ncbi:MAG: ABC transporter permease [Clostridiales bacterium]|nr:ABC transporter permease [Clostridiales bacterium]
MKERLSLAPLPGLFLLAALVLVPLLFLLYWSFRTGIGPASSWTLAHIYEIWQKPFYLRLLGKSLLTAATVTLWTIVLAWPAAWALARVFTRWQTFLLILALVPYLTSYLLLIYAMMVLLAHGGPLMSLISWLHLAHPESSILYTPWATILMLVYENVPIMLLLLFNASQRIDPHLLEAAQILGAGPLQRFLHVIFPLSLPSLLAGMVLVFVPVAGSFVEAQILGGPYGLLLGNVIADQVSRIYRPTLGAALSLLLLASVLIILGAGQLLARKRAAYDV